MAKVFHPTLTVRKPAGSDVAGINFYWDDANTPSFIGTASNGDWPVDHTLFVRASADSEFVSLELGQDALPDGVYDFAVASVEVGSGNLSDAVTSAEFTDVPLDLSAPGVPTDLSITRS